MRDLFDYRVAVGKTSLLIRYDEDAFTMKYGNLSYNTMLIPSMVIY
jgi:hypothetical protein